MNRDARRVVLGADEHVYESIDDLTTSLAHATTADHMRGVDEDGYEKIEDPTSCAEENRNGLSLATRNIGKWQESEVKPEHDARLRRTGEVEHERGTDPTTWEVQDGNLMHVSKVGNRTRCGEHGYNEIPGYHCVNDEPRLEQAIAENERRANEVGSASEVRQSKNFAERHDQGYEHINYDPRWMEISQRRSNEVNDSSHFPAEPKLSSNMGCASDEVLCRISSDAHVRSAYETPRESPDESNHKELGNETISGYERVKYDPRVEQAYLEY